MISLSFRTIHRSCSILQSGTSSRWRQAVRSRSPSKAKSKLSFVTQRALHVLLDIDKLDPLFGHRKDSRSCVGVLHRVKGTLCKNLQSIQHTSVAFALFWLVLFWGFRGDTGAVVAAFDSPLLGIMNAKGPISARRRICSTLMRHWSS
jgi:hypothetical protein